MGFHKDSTCNAELQGTMALQPRWYIAALQQAQTNNWVYPPCKGDSCKDANPEVRAVFPQLAEIM